MKTAVKERAKSIEGTIKTMVPGSNYTVDCTDVWRDGGVRTAYILHEEGSNNNCSPAVYIDDGDWYHKGDEAVAEYLLGLYKTHSRQVDVSKVVSADYVIERVLPRLSPIRNIEGLREHGIICEEYLNLAVSYYLPFDFDSREDATIQVTKQLLDCTGLETDSLGEYALSNLRGEVDFMSMGEMLRCLVGVGIDDVPSGADDAVPMWILTLRSKQYGAAVLLFGPPLFERLENRFGKPVSLLASSVHELIAVPYDHPEQLQDYLRMVREVNSTQVSEADYLADSVYYFDGHQVRVLV